MKKISTRLSLNKRTISNLRISQMQQQLGGDQTNANKCTNQCSFTCSYCYTLQNDKTCIGHCDSAHCTGHGCSGNLC